MKLQLKTVQLFEVQYLATFLDPVPSLHRALQTDMQLSFKRKEEEPGELIGYYVCLAEGGYFIGICKFQYSVVPVLRTNYF